MFYLFGSKIKTADGFMDITRKTIAAIFVGIFAVGLVAVGIVEAADCDAAFKSIRKERNLIKKKELLEGAIKQCPNDAEINYMNGYTLERLRNYDEALQYYKKAAKLDEKSAKYLFGMGDIYMVQGDSNAAIAVYEKGLSISPESKRAQKSLELARQSTGSSGPTVLHKEVVTAVKPVVVPEKKVPVPASPPAVEKVAQVQPTPSLPVKSPPKKEITPKEVKSKPTPPPEVVQKKAEAPVKVVIAEPKKTVTPPAPVQVAEKPAPHESTDLPVAPVKVVIAEPKKTVTPPTPVQVAEKPQSQKIMKSAVSLEIDLPFVGQDNLLSLKREDNIDQFRKAMLTEDMQKHTRLEMSFSEKNTDDSRLENLVSRRRKELESSVETDSIQVDPERPIIPYFR
ncbi:MAG: tetratricopeptide repeat protein [Proteobacteria bacterium]|nr:tetratricopeptide repeat protein [Pseudomonadota bacterium]MBU1709913.1 tetratricopeptide repeat protein [Pseudomonadota bacterium]